MKNICFSLVWFQIIKLSLTYLVLRIPNGWHCSCGCRIMNATLHLVSIRSICLWASALKLFVECSLSSISLFFHQLGHNGFHCLCSLWKRMKRKMRWKFLGQLLWRIFVFAEDVIKRICLRHCNTTARCKFLYSSSNSTRIIKFDDI